MATWSNLSDSTARLTIEESDTGAIYRERTLTGLTPSELHTFYLTSETDADGLNTEPFLQVVGGDTAIAEEAGEETLVARGDSNGSGEITLRMGVQDAGNAPTSEGSDDLDYANQAAAEAADWTVTDTASSGSITFNTGHPIPGSGISTSILMNGGDGTGEVRLEKTFAVTNGQQYTVKLWVESNSAPWWELLNLWATSGANIGADGLGGNEPVEEIAATVIADGTSLTVSIFIGAGFFARGFYVAGLSISGLGGATVVDFRPLGACTGTGIGATGTLREAA